MSATVESFVAVLKRSGLIESSALAQTLESLNGTPSPEALAATLTQRELITDWQAAKLLKGKHKGFFLGKYKLLSLLGKGGMSSVYLAEHVLMRRRCAIKVLPWKRVNDSSYLERFHREAQAVAALDHPNIVRAYDVDHEKDGNLEINFLVMEFVDGKNLFEIVQREGPMSAVRAADYIRQGANGLEHAHRAGLVHRDIKPGNFLLDPSGIVKLMDLGLARAHQEGEDFSLTIEHDEKVLGTADYLAPEQAVDSHRVDARADIYGLGCTLYYLLVGQPPFNEGTLTQRLLAHQTKDPPEVKTLRDDIPESLIVILKKMMRKDREDRTQSAEAVFNELTDWLHENGGTEWQPPEDRLTRRSGDSGTRSSSTTKAGSAATNTIAGTKATTPREDPPEVENELGAFLSALSDPNLNDSSSKKTEAPSSKVTKSTAPDSHVNPGDSEINVGPVPDEEDKSAPFTFTDVESAEPTAPVVKQKTTTTQPIVTEPTVTPIPEPRQSPKQATTSLKSSSGQRKKSNNTRLKQIIVTAVAAVAGVIIMFFMMNSGDENKARTVEKEIKQVTPAPDTQPKENRPAVEGRVVTVGPKGHFGTISAALEYISDQALRQSSDPVREVQVDAEITLNETIHIDNSGLGSFPKGVRIIGQGDEPPKLRPTSGEAAISLDNVENLTIENIDIQVQDAPVAIDVAGYLVGTRLSRLTVTGFSDHGIHARGVAGFGGQQFTVENSLIKGTNSKAVGVKFESSSMSDSHQAVIRNCRIVGPLDTGIQIDQTATDVTFIRNRFHALGVGIRFTNSSQDLSNVQIQNNTFHNLDRGIAFDSGPNVACQKVTFTQNLFVDIAGSDVTASRSDADLGALTKGAPAPRYNWSSSAMDAAVDLDVFQQDGRRGISVEFHSLDAENVNFLKPKLGELRSAVKQSNGPNAFIGAVAP